MKKLMVGCFALMVGIAGLGLFSSGCGSSNSSTAPVTVTTVQQPTPSCGGQLGFGTVVSGVTGSSGYIEAYPVTLAIASKTLDMAVYLGATVSGSVELAVFSDNSGTPHIYLDGGAITSPTANSWNIAILTGQDLAAGKYWLAMQNSSSDSVAYGSSQTTTDYELAQSYGPFPSTMSGGTAYPSVQPRAILLDTTCQ